VNITLDAHACKQDYAPSTSINAGPLGFFW
jgi:hypothetical protein